MSKFTLVKEIADHKTRHQAQVYEAIKYRRRKDLQSMAKDADDYMDRRRNRKAKLASAAKLPQSGPVKIKDNPRAPEGYISAVQAAKALGIYKGTISLYCSDGRLPGIKFPNGRFKSLAWFITQDLFRYLEQRIRQGLPLAEVKKLKLTSKPAELVNGLILANDAALELEVSPVMICKYCRDGTIDGKKIVHNNSKQWAITEESMNKLRFRRTNGVPLNGKRKRAKKNG